MYLTEEQKNLKIEAYIAAKKAQGDPWDTLALDYLRKDLDADIWDENGNEIEIWDEDGNEIES